MPDTITSSIVYDDDEIQVIWHPGASDFILMTFGDLGSRADGERFFADTPVKKQNISCIGIMPKSPNWFPTCNMVKASDAINSLSLSFASRILYGGSMGGYAAIKFSRLLNATDVISLCPQYSIAPEECEDSKNSWKQYFRPSMAGMRIQANDIFGNLNIFYDPFDRIDRYHFQMIKLEGHEVNGHVVPMIGHHITVAFAGTSNLMELIVATRAKDIDSINTFSRNRRRYNRYRLERILRWARDRHPQSAYRIFQAVHRKYERVMFYMRYQEFMSAMELTTRFGHLDDKMSYTRSYLRHASSPKDQVLAAAYLDAILPNKVGIETDHGTFFSYDPKNDKLIHSSDRAYTFLLRWEMTGQYISLFLLINGMRIYLATDDVGQVVAKFDSEDGRQPYFLMTSSKAGVFELQYNGQYLCAERSGRLIFNRSAASGWEQFRFDVRQIE